MICYPQKPCQIGRCLSFSYAVVHFVPKKALFKIYSQLLCQNLLRPRKSSSKCFPNIQLIAPHICIKINVAQRYAVTPAVKFSETSLMRLAFGIEVFFYHTRCHFFCGVSNIVKSGRLGFCAFFALFGSRECNFNSIYAKIVYRYFHKNQKMWYIDSPMHNIQSASCPILWQQ